MEYKALFLYLNVGVSDIFMFWTYFVAFLSLENIKLIVQNCLLDEDNCFWNLFGKFRNTPKGRKKVT